MHFNILNKNDEIVMSLVHYFITEENYTPIVVKGVKDEIWLENLDGPYRIIRINSNYIHNDEQYKFDQFKTKKVMEQIKKKTLSISMNTLNIFLNLGDNVHLPEDEKNISSIKFTDIDEVLKDKNIITVFPNIKDKLIKDKEGIDLIVNVTNDINAKTVEENKVFTKIFEPKKMIITPIIIAICVLVFIAMYIWGRGSEDTITLLMFGANFRPLVQAGEVWRLATSMFLHIGIIHLLVNMYSLLIIGRQLESFLGKWKFLIVYLGSGILGSLLSVVIHSSISAGASGAIFGLLGSLLYFGYHYRLYLGTVLKTQVIPIIIINLLIGFMVPGIDNFAHIGGLVGGYLITMAVGIPGKSKKNDRINGIIVLTLLISFLCYMLFGYLR
ncbi:MAG TPA: rhomboid family intramembrane serine protease [Candidatus Caccenecus avistercoris]|nr:rhomboid family intramembrane serine protease [Candidatus Caccenecus avistercoris]